MTHSRTLGLGLKFKPTRQPPAARVFDNYYYFISEQHWYYLHNNTSHKLTLHTTPTLVHKLLTTKFTF